MRNAAAITPKDPPVADPIAALQRRRPARRRAAHARRLPTRPRPAPDRRAARQSGVGTAPAAPDASDRPPSAGRAGAGGDQKTLHGPSGQPRFQGADLRAVLRGFSEISGLNMVIDPDVQGTVDIILNEVPWDQALDVILRGNQLDYTVDGTIVRIARIDTLRKEQDSRQALAKSAADAGTLAVRTFSLSYARASARRRS